MSGREVAAILRDFTLSDILVSFTWPVMSPLLSYKEAILGTIPKAPWMNIRSITFWTGEVHSDQHCPHPEIKCCQQNWPRRAHNLVQIEIYTFTCEGRDMRDLEEW